MTYDTLILLQSGAKLFFSACLLGGLVYMVAGLFNPKWLGLTRRRWAVLRSLGVVLIGFIVMVGTIIYTHSHPNGPHSFANYLKLAAAKDCARGKQTQICEELRKQCEIPTIFPPCQIYHETKRKLDDQRGQRERHYQQPNASSQEI
jgi:hypothetical protein